MHTHTRGHTTVWRPFATTAKQQCKNYMRPINAHTNTATRMHAYTGAHCGMCNNLSANV